MATAPRSTSSAPDAPARSVVHATFRIERTYPSAPAQVYHALTNQDAKAKWFGGGTGFTELARRMDVRTGGRERLQGRWDSGAHPPSSRGAPSASVISTFDAVYLDVIPNQRLVYAYEMHLDERKISVSLATLELKSAGAAVTRLVLTEQGAFLDGYDDAGARERGTGHLLDALGRAVADGH